MLGYLQENYLADVFLVSDTYQSLLKVMKIFTNIL